MRSSSFPREQCLEGFDSLVAMMYHACLAERWRPWKPIGEYGFIEERPPRRASRIPCADGTGKRAAATAHKIPTGGTDVKYVIWAVRFWYAGWMIPAGLEHFYHIYPQPGYNTTNPLAHEMLFALLHSHLFDARQSR